MTVILAGPVSLMLFGGVYLLRADEKSIRLSIIAQAFQIPFISSPAIQYFMFSPVALYFQAGTNGSVGFDSGFFGNISFLLMTDVNGITVGINVVAAGVLIYLYRALNFLKSHDRLPRKLKCSTCNANFGWDTEFESREIKCDYCSEITTFENEREIN